MLEEYQGSLKTLEEHIGYGFRSPALLKQALTHSSFANEQRMRCWSW